MAIKNDKFSKFKGYISINSASISPEVSPNLQGLAEFQDLLNSEVTSFSFLGSDFLMAKEYPEGGLYASGKDLSKVSGVFNYAQAITHRLITYRGTMPGDANFGIPWDNYIGKTYSNRSLVIADLKQEIETEIFKDRRTSSVENIVVEFLNPTVINVDLTIIPIYRNLPSVVELTITSGD